MADRRVDYVLGVRQDGSGSRAFDDLSRKAKELETNANRAGRAVGAAQRGGSMSPGGSSSLPGSAGDGSQSKGFAETFFTTGRGDFSLRTAMRAFIAVRAIQATLNSAATMATALDNETLTGAGQDRAIKEAIPALGGFMKEIFTMVDVFSGFSKDLRIVNREIIKAGALAIIDAQLATENRAVGRTGAEARNRSDSLSGAMALARTPEMMAKLNAGLGLASADPMERRKHLERLAGPFSDALMAHAGVDEAKRNQNTSFNELLDSTIDVNKNFAKPQRRMMRPEEVLSVEENRKRLGGGMFGRIGTDETNKQRLQFEGQFGLKQNELLETKRAIERMSKAEADMVEKKVAIAKAENVEAKANLAIAKEKHAILKEEEGRLIEGAQSFGALHPEERATAVMLAQQLKQNGLGAMSDAEKALLGRAGGGQAMQDAAEKSARADPAFAAFNKAIGRRGFGEVGAELDIEAAKITLKVILNEDELAEKIAKILGDAVKQIEATNEMKANNAKALEINRQNAAAAGLKLP